MIDIIVVGIFLAITALIGYVEGRKIKTVKEFALSNKNYSTSVLIATIFATVIGGGSTLGVVEKVYQYGYIFILPFFGMALNRIVIGRYFAPYLVQYYKDAISLGDILKKLYGDEGRYLAGISIVLVSIGSVGTQVFAVGQIFEYLLHIPHLYGIIVSFSIIIMYSSLGGMRSVIATDVLQFVFIVVMLPVLFTICVKTVGGPINFILEAKSQIFTKEDSLKLATLVFISFFMSSGDPSFLQRLLIAKDSKQAAKSMILAGYFSIVFYILMGFVGIVALTKIPGIAPSSSLIVLVQSMVPAFIKGIVICGLLAAMMSTADSDLNMVGISTVHELLSPKMQEKLTEENKLLIARISTLFLGVFSLLIAIKFDSILDIMLYAFSFWGPGALIPLAMGILRYGVPKKHMLYGVFLGAIVTLSWNHSIQPLTQVPGIIVGMVLHFLFFIARARKIQ